MHQYVCISGAASDVNAVALQARDGDLVCLHFISSVFGIATVSKLSRCSPQVPFSFEK